MEDAYKQIIESIGEDLNRPGLKDTPLRAAEAMRFLTQGYRLDVDDVINGALFPSDSDEMVIVKNIELYSLCEHHLLPLSGSVMSLISPRGKLSASPRLPALLIYSRGGCKSRKILPIRLPKRYFLKLAVPVQASLLRHSICA